MGVADASERVGCLLCRKSVTAGRCCIYIKKGVQESEQAFSCTKSFLHCWLRFDKKNGSNLPQGCRVVSLSERWSERPLGAQVWLMRAWLLFVVSM